MKYTFDENKRQLFCALIILDAIVDKGYRFSTNLLSYDEQKLLPVLDRMVSNETLFINDIEHEYQPTEKGMDLVNNFFDRYQEFIKFYDIYCAVDLNTREFAFSQILDMSEEDFQRYIKDSRWEDVRVAVCEFKKIDPMQMVFLSLLREGRIDINQSGWCVNLLNGDIWDYIIKVCDTAISLEQLTPNEQINNIILMGSDILKTLLEREKEEQEQQENDTTTITETTTEEVVDDGFDIIGYYNPYFYDPYYISPCWDWYYYEPVWW